MHQWRKTTAAIALTKECEANTGYNRDTIHSRVFLLA